MTIIAFLFVCAAMAGLFFQCKKGPGGQTAIQAPGAGKSPDAAPAQSRSVVFNGRSLDDRTVDALEQAYRVRVMNGRYWYDRMNGSWGVEGGPSSGFIIPGLELGGPLQADASKGNTGVFINGRELHAIDVARLSLLGPVYRGRYWMDAMGNIGFEGMPAALNIWVAIQALGGGGRGQREGILSTYDKTGMTVIGN